MPTQTPEMTTLQALDVLHVLRRGTNVSLDEARALLHEMVEVSEGQVIPSVEPVSGLTSMREESPSDLRWALVITSRQRSVLGGDVDDLRISTLENHGWSVDGLENFWVLDFLLSGAVEGKLQADERDYFREEVDECLRTLEMEPDLAFERGVGDGWIGWSPQVSERLDQDGSWRVAMPMTVAARKKVLGADA